MPIVLTLARTVATALLLTSPFWWRPAGFGGRPAPIPPSPREMNAEQRWRQQLDAAGVPHVEISNVAFEAEIAAGRAVLNAVVQQVPAVPPVGELQAELVLGVRALVRRTASGVPHPRPADRLAAVVAASIPAVLHRTRLRRRYAGVEDAAKAGTTGR